MIFDSSMKPPFFEVQNAPKPPEKQETDDGTSEAADPLLKCSRFIGFIGFRV